MKRIFVAVSLAIVSAVVNATPMLPLVQSYRIQAGTVVQDGFRVKSPSVAMMAVSTDSSSSLAVMLPDGTALSEGNASNHGFRWDTTVNASTGARTISVISDQAPIGDYTFIVTAGSRPTVFSVTETPSPVFATFIGSERSAVEPGKYFAVAMALSSDSEPATGASITAEVLKTNGERLDTIQLADDGQKPDATASDGVYTSVSSISEEGKYWVRFDVDWAGHKGRVNEPVRVAQSNFALTGDFQTEAVDNNNNGLVDAIVLTFAENVERGEGEYTVNARIADAEGETVDAANAIYDPNEPLSVVFDVARLKKLGRQPWTVEVVGLLKVAEPLGYLTNLGPVNVDPSTFETPPLVVTGVSSDRGVDEDGDGVFEKLEVAVEVVTREAGYYGLSTDLRGAGNELVSDTGASSTYLSEGSNILTLSFLGSDIGGVGADGPFRITNFLIYPNFNSQEDVAELINFVGETSSYSCAEFAGCGSDLEAEIRRIASTLCPVQRHQLLAKLKRIEVIGRSKPDVAERQLKGLYDRAKALERSGSCPPAEGWQSDRQAS